MNYQPNIIKLLINLGFCYDIFIAKNRLYFDKMSAVNQMILQIRMRRPRGCRIGEERTINEGLGIVS